MTEPTEEINQELDDILLDDLVEVQERTPGTEEPNLTPGETIYDDRRDDIVEAEISRISGELELSESTQRTAMSLFDQYAEQDDLTGNALEVLAGACLYTACKVESVPLSPDDFVSVPETAFTRNILLRRVKSIASTLGLNPQAFSDPTHYVDHYCEDLGLGDEITERAHEILAKADEAGIGSGKSPTARAAAAVYLAGIESGRKVTQADIADTADVSKVTIRNRYQDQAEILNSSSSQKEAASDVAIKEHVGETSETVAEPLNIEASAFQPYVSDGVAEKIVSSLRQIEEVDEALVKACIEICEIVNKSGGFDDLEADNSSIALAIIRKASMDIDQLVGYPKLKRTVNEHDDKLHRVTSNLDEKL